MPGTPPSTPRMAIGRISDGDSVQAALTFNGISDRVDLVGAMFQSGTNAARLAATNIDGLVWRETDTAGQPLYYGTGSAWIQLTPSRGATNIATSESRSNTAYGTLTTPDQVTGIVLPTNGLIRVRYQATWQESVGGAGRAAIFIGANQLKIATNVAAVTQAAGLPGANAATNRALASAPFGLVSEPDANAYPGDVTTGQAVGLAITSGTSLYHELNGTVQQVTTGAPATGAAGGSCDIFLPAGTYTVSVQFKASSGSVTASNRKLWAEAVPFG